MQQINLQEVGTDRCKLNNLLKLQEEKWLVAEINKLKHSKQNLRYSTVGIQVAMIITMSTLVYKLHSFGQIWA